MNQIIVTALNKSEILYTVYGHRSFQTTLQGYSKLRQVRPALANVNVTVWHLPIQR